MIRSLKTIALSTVVVLATTVGSFAATYAWVDEDTRVKDDPSKWADTIAWADEGEKVKILDYENGYYYVKRDGKDGWIRDDDLSFGGGDFEIEFDFGNGNFEIEFEL